MPKPRALEGEMPIPSASAVGGAGGSRRCWLLVLHAAMPPRTWIRLPPFFASAFRQGRLLELWRQHAACSPPAPAAEVAITASGEVFMTRGWGEIARGCRTRGALTIHLEYDGASVMFFKIFDAIGRRLECCPRGGSQDLAMVRARPADSSLDGSTSDGSAGGSSD